MAEEVGTGVIVSHKHKFIFVKTRKTAGSSIQWALEEFCGPEDIVTTLHEPFTDLSKLKRQYKERNTRPNGEKIDSHLPASAIRRIVGAEIWEEYFTFVFVRNPWDWAVAQWWWEKVSGKDPRGFEWWIKHLWDHPRFWNTHIYKDKGGQDLVDFLGRFENLQEDFSEVCSKIGIETPELPWLKKNHHPDRKEYRTYYFNQELIDLVSRCCGEEIERFDYTF